MSGRLRDEVEGRWRVAAESIERVRGQLHPARAPGAASLPLSLSEAQAVVQARIEADEKRQAKSRAMGRSHGRERDANRDSADGRNGQIVRARVPWEKKDKNVFWLYVEVRPFGGEKHSQSSRPIASIDSR